MRLEDAKIEDFLPARYEIIFEREGDGSLKVRHQSPLVEGDESFPQGMLEVRARVRFTETILVFEGPARVGVGNAAYEPYRYTAPGGTVAIRLPVTEDIVTIPDFEKVVTPRLLSAATAEYILQYRLAHKLEEALLRAGIKISRRQRDYLDFHQRGEPMAFQVRLSGGEANHAIYHLVGHPAALPVEIEVDDAGTRYRVTDRKDDRGRPIYEYISESE
jgi:hypothetical protein